MYIRVGGDRLVIIGVLTIGVSDLCAYIIGINMTSQAVVSALAVIFVAMLSLVYTYPHGEVWPPDYTRIEQSTNECRSREDVETLCQTCAKQTRSNIVYPMCCEGKEEARPWCERLLAYWTTEAEDKEKPKRKNFEPATTDRLAIFRLG